MLGSPKDANRVGAPCPGLDEFTCRRLGRGMVTVVPLTSNVSRVFPFHVLLHAATTGLRADSKAQAEQVRSVAVERLGPALSQLPSDIMHEVDEALRLHLQL